MPEGLTNPAVQDAIEYWRRRVGEGNPTLELPEDDGRADATGSLPISFSAATAAAVRVLAARCDASPEAVLHAAFQTFVARIGGRREPLVGTMVRTPLGKWLPCAVPIAFTASLSFRQAVEHVDRLRRKALEHAIPAELFLQLADTSPDRGLFAGSVLVHDGTDHPPSAFADPASGGAVVLVVCAGSDPWSGALRYDPRRLARSTVAAWVVALTYLTRRLVAHPDRSVLAEPMLPQRARGAWRGGVRPYRRPRIHYATVAGPFEDQVRRTPHAVAVVDCGAEVSYSQLNARANRLARRLVEGGAGPGERVASCQQRSVHLITALLAIAKTGAAYVPLDPDLPDSRIEYMLQDAAPSMVCVDRTTRNRIGRGSWELVEVEGDRVPSDPPGSDIDLTAPAVPRLVSFLYTSGTTGRPKAVAYPVDGALADIAWYQRRYPFRRADTALFKISYGFDVSIFEIFWPLFCGARVVVCPPGQHGDPAQVAELLGQHAVTSLFVVPSMLAAIVDRVPDGGLPALRSILSAGETLSPGLRDRVHQRLPGVTLVNCFGPTELGCVAEGVVNPDPSGALVTVGRPPSSRRVYLMDDNLRPVPTGVAGELFVGGEVGMAYGYHRQMSLTAASFVADPHGVPGSRMYRTGDQCRWRADGTLEHLGRLGRQVKIRGVRVEPAEIEAVLGDHPGVATCAVVCSYDDAGPELAAFVVPRVPQQADDPAGLEPPSEGDLRAYLTGRLPAQMVPAAILAVDRIPTSVNGKVDRAALLELRKARAAASDLTPIPRDDTERRLTRLFSEVLGKEVVDMTADFFALGGHSLLVFALVERCRSEFEIDLTVRDVLTTLSIRELGSWITERLTRSASLAATARG